MLIPESVLLNMQTKQLERLVAIGEIHRNTPTPTQTGGMAPSWSPVATGIAMGVAPGPSGQGQEQQLIIERFGSAVSYYLLFPAGFDIRPEDRVFQTSPVVRQFEVVAIPNKDISFETMRRVLGVELG